MKWFAGVLCGVVALSAPMLAPDRPAWQVVAGIVYPIAVLLCIRLLDVDFDFVDLLVDLASENRRNSRPIQAAWKRITVRILQVVGIWLSTTIVGLCLTFVPLVPYSLTDRISPWHFVLGTLVGTGFYLSLAYMGRKLLARRYGY